MTCIICEKWDVEKYFDADAYNEELHTVIEVKAGRGVTYNHFLKEIFQDCRINDVKYLVITVRNIFRNNKDFDSAVTFFDTMYDSDRLKLLLEEIIIIGY